MKPVVIHRQRKYEAEQAIRDLEKRGYMVVFPLTSFSRDGKTFDRDNFNRKIFVENTHTTCWIAKMVKVEKCDSCDAVLRIDKGEDFFVEDENGGFVLCENCWLEYEHKSKGNDRRSD